jgi:hypothetical protein
LYRRLRGSGKHLTNQTPGFTRGHNCNALTGLFFCVQKEICGLKITFKTIRRIETFMTPGEAGGKESIMNFKP